MFVGGSGVGVDVDVGVMVGGSVATAVSVGGTIKVVGIKVGKTAVCSGAASMQPGNRKIKIMRKKNGRKMRPFEKH